MPHDIFISYSRRDLAAVKPIKEELESLGFSCWMDLEGIESGSPEFTEKIAEAIGESTAVLFFLSTASQASRWSLNELRLARSKGRRIVLVRFNKEPMQDKFILEFGGSDIIDWRTSEQREKLGRDLSRWTGKGNDAAPSFNFGDSDVGGWRILERVRKLKRDFCRWMIRKTRTTIIGQGRDAHIS